MIQVLNFPLENRYLLDGNQTQITVTSDNAEGYFRAKIYIDDVFFDEQGWSRKDDFTATKDLLYLYNSYFKPYFIGTFETGLLEQTNFKKKISITINEHSYADDEIIQTVTLPDFYLLYNVKSALFNDSNKVYLFGIKSERMNMKKEGTIVIPFYANASEEDVKVTVFDDLHNILHTQTIADVDGKKVYLYTLNLTPGLVISQALYLKARIEVGGVSVEKIYNILRLPNYEVNEIVFQNNFGFYIPAYFDGDFEDTVGYKMQSYERYDNSTAVYAVEEDVAYTINTGGLSVLEKDIVNEVATSIDCFFKNGENYARVNTGTKKSTNKKSRLNIYSEDLQFSFKAGLPFSNFNLEEDISDFELELLSVTPSFALHYIIAFSANFPLFQVAYRVRKDETFLWSAPHALSSAVSPQGSGTLLYVDGFQMQLFTNYNATTIFSNIFTYIP